MFKSKIPKNESHLKKAALCAYGVANVFTMSSFNTVLTIKQMPYLPFMFNSTQYKKTARDCMEPIETYLTEKMTLFSVLDLFIKKRVINMSEFLPVVNDVRSKIIIGSVRTENLLNYLEVVAKDIDREIRKISSRKHLLRVIRKHGAKLYESGLADSSNKVKEPNNWS